LLYGVFGGGGDAFEDVEGFDSGFEEAEGEGGFGEGFEGRDVGVDGGGVGEGEEFIGLEFLFFGEGDEVVAEDDEDREEVLLLLGEFGKWGRGDHEETVQGGGRNASGKAGAGDNTLSPGFY
jgi:hypothetical protein